MAERFLDPERRQAAGARVRAGLRRHGLIRRPPELRQLLRAAEVRFTTGNAVELFPDGESGLAAMLAAIEEATRRVHLETYILRSDDTGWRFARALVARARAGVRVRLLYDAVGSRGLDPRLPRELSAAGADVVAFNPLRRLYPRWAPRRRDHRKILVVDGALAFTGGLNIGDEYYFGPALANGSRAPWRDAHVRVQGPAAGLLEAVFLESWFRADGPDTPWSEIPLSAAAPRPLGEEIVGLLADGPTYHRRRMRDVLVIALGRARGRARLVTPYFVPGFKLRRALAAAAERGVEVELLIAGLSDHPVVRWAAHALLPGLVARGVRVFEYERTMMHAKAAVFDESWAILGTSNLDAQSLQHSYEVNLIFHGGALPRRLSSLLRADMDAARALTADVLGRRPGWQRLRDRFAAWLVRRL